MEKGKSNCNKRPISELSAEESGCSKRPRGLLGCCGRYCVNGFGDIILDEKEKYFLLGRLAEIEIANEIIEGKDLYGELNEDGYGFGDMNLAEREDEKEKCYLLGRLAEIQAVNEIIDGEDDHGLEDINLHEQQLSLHELENEKYFLLGRLAELEVAKEIIDWMPDPNLPDEEDDEVRTDMGCSTNVDT